MSPEQVAKENKRITDQQQEFKAGPFWTSGACDHNWLRCIDRDSYRCQFCSQERLRSEFGPAPWTPETKDLHVPTASECIEAMHNAASGLDSRLRAVVAKYGLGPNSGCKHSFRPYYGLAAEPQFHYCEHCDAKSGT